MLTGPVSAAVKRRECTIRGGDLRNGSSKGYVEVARKRHVKLPSDSHRAFALMLDVGRRPQEPEGPIVSAFPSEEQDRAVHRDVVLVPPTGLAVGCRRALALPVDYAARLGIVAVPGRWGE